MTLMRDEIHEIPSVVERLLREGVEERRAAARAVHEARPRWVAIVARGTSDHAAIYARYLIETHLGLQTGLAAASVTTTYNAALDWRDTLVLAVSQSGQSPDICAVAEAARQGGALTIAVTNDPDSPLAAITAGTLLLHARQERSVAATKTYVATLAVVAALVSELAPDSELAGALPHLPDALGEATLASEAWIAEGRSPFAEFAAADRAFVVSRGHNLSTALEVALKLKETALIMADGYSTADFLHGPVVLSGAEVPLLFFRPDGRVGAAIDEGVAKARLMGAKPWIVGGPELLATKGKPEPLVLDIGLPEALTPLAYAIPGQLLAEAVARRRGLDPDAPQGLTKVTRTR
jgi:glucosamine--fructose-6-phosphate aminotransferase (isomerizing)